MHQENKINRLLSSSRLVCRKDRRVRTGSEREEKESFCLKSKFSENLRSYITLLPHSTHYGHTKSSPFAVMFYGTDK